jgi:hypothetical protein
LQNSFCKGCDNQCYINIYKFVNGQHFISGNKCEKVYSNKGTQATKGRNIYAEKYKLLFERESITSPIKIGIPRALGMYENYPFWHRLFTECGLEVVLSSHSKYEDYENAVSGVMSDNICFPAKLIHSHIHDLQKKQVTRIFYPMVEYEEMDEQTANSYNCPIVFAYSEILKTDKFSTPLDAPMISFRTKKGLYKNVINYLKTFEIDKKAAEKAIKSALFAQKHYAETIYQKNLEIYNNVRKGEGAKGRRGERAKGRRGERAKGRRGEGAKGRRGEGAKGRNFSFRAFALSCFRAFACNL